MVGEHLAVEYLNVLVAQFIEIFLNYVYALLLVNIHYLPHRFTLQTRPATG